MILSIGKTPWSLILAVHLKLHSTHIFLMKMIAMRKISKVQSLSKCFRLQDNRIRRRTILFSRVSCTSSTFKAPRIRICYTCSEPLSRAVIVLCTHGNQTSLRMEFDPNPHACTSALIEGLVCTLFRAKKCTERIRH